MINCTNGMFQTSLDNFRDKFHELRYDLYVSCPQNTKLRLIDTLSWLYCLVSRQSRDIFVHNGCLLNYNSL